MIHLPYTTLTNTKVSLKRKGWSKERDEKVSLTLPNNWKTNLNNVLEDKAFINTQLHLQGLWKIMWTLIITGVNIICVGYNENIAIIFYLSFLLSYAYQCCTNCVQFKPWVKWYPNHKNMFSRSFCKFTRPIVWCFIVLFGFPDFMIKTAYIKYGKTL